MKRKTMYADWLHHPLLPIKPLERGDDGMISCQITRTTRSLLIGTYTAGTRIAVHESDIVYKTRVSNYHQLVIMVPTKDLNTRLPYDQLAEDNAIYNRSISESFA